MAENRKGTLARPGRGEVLYAVHPAALRRRDRAAKSTSSSTVKDNGVEKVQDSKPGRAR